MTTQKASPDDWPAIIREINLPVRELSARTGVDKGTISRIARGEIRDPRDSTARTLRNFLEVLRTNNGNSGTTPAIPNQGIGVATNGYADEGARRTAGEQQSSQGEDVR